MSARRHGSTSGGARPSAGATSAITMIVTHSPTPMRPSSARVGQRHVVGDGDGHHGVGRGEAVVRRRVGGEATPAEAEGGPRFEHAQGSAVGAQALIDRALVVGPLVGVGAQPRDRTRAQRRRRSRAPTATNGSQPRSRRLLSIAAAAPTAAPTDTWRVRVRTIPTAHMTIMASDEHRMRVESRQRARMIAPATMQSNMARPFAPDSRRGRGSVQRCCRAPGSGCTSAPRGCAGCARPRTG